MLVIGGGLAGLSTAHHLSRRAVGSIAVVESGDFMALTSDNSTGGYRNYYPAQPPMVRLSNRSIDLMEEIADLTNNSPSLEDRSE